MTHPVQPLAPIPDPKKDANCVFYELTRTICPECRRVIDGHVLIRDNKVYMRKRPISLTSFHSTSAMPKASTSRTPPSTPTRSAPSSICSQPYFRPS